MAKVSVIDSDTIKAQCKVFVRTYSNIQLQVDNFIECQESTIKNFVELESWKKWLEENKELFILSYEQLEKGA